MSKITHDQVRNILNKIYYYCKDIPRQEELEQYILQQEKQQKLLELYKELHNKYRYPTWQDDEYVKEIQEKIKELENEKKI